MKQSKVPNLSLNDKKLLSEIEKFHTKWIDVLNEWKAIKGIKQSNEPLYILNQFTDITYDEFAPKYYDNFEFKNLTINDFIILKQVCIMLSECKNNIDNLQGKVQKSDRMNYMTLSDIKTTFKEMKECKFFEIMQDEIQRFKIQTTKQESTIKGLKNQLQVIQKDLFRTISNWCSLKGFEVTQKSIDLLYGDIKVAIDRDSFTLSKYNNKLNELKAKDLLLLSGVTQLYDICTNCFQKIELKNTSLTDLLDYTKPLFDRNELVYVNVMCTEIEQN